jgi:hypothetical protein
VGSDGRWSHEISSSCIVVFGNLVTWTILYIKCVFWLQVLLMTLQNAPPGLDYERDKRFSKVVQILSADYHI